MLVQYRLRSALRGGVRGSLSSQAIETGLLDELVLSEKKKQIKKPARGSKRAVPRRLSQLVNRSRMFKNLAARLQEQTAQENFNPIVTRDRERASCRMFCFYFVVVSFTRRASDSGKNRGRKTNTHKERKQKQRQLKCSSTMQFRRQQ